MTDIKKAEECMNLFIVRAEQDEMAWEDKEKKTTSKKYLHVIDSICTGLQNVVNSISYVGYRKVEIFIPLPNVIQTLILSYDEDHAFNPNLKYLNYFTERSIYMERFIHYVRQTSFVRAYMYRRQKARDVINHIEKEIDNRMSEISDLIPLNVRKNKEYKNRMIMSNNTVSCLVVSYLDIDDITDLGAVYNLNISIFNDIEEELDENEVFFFL
jgi:hypothetical protein